MQEDKMSFKETAVKGFCMFYDWVEDLEPLGGEDAWQIVKALRDYYLTGQAELSSLPPYLEALTRVILHQVKRQEEASNLRSQQGRIGGINSAKKSAKKKQQENNARELEPKSSELQPKASELQPKASELQPKASEVQPRSSEVQPKASELQGCFKQNQATETETDTDTDTETDTDTDTDTDTVVVVCGEPDALFSPPLPRSVRATATYEGNYESPLYEAAAATYEGNYESPLYEATATTYEGNYEEFLYEANAEATSSEAPPDELDPDYDYEPEIPFDSAFGNPAVAAYLVSSLSDEKEKGEKMERAEKTDKAKEKEKEEKKEEEELYRLGLPAEYVAARRERAAAFGQSCRRSTRDVLLSWWRDDRAYYEQRERETREADRNKKEPPYGGAGAVGRGEHTSGGARSGSGSSEGTRSGSSEGKSYDLEDFFAAAVERALEE